MLREVMTHLYGEYLITAVPGQVPHEETVLGPQFNE